ncbi:MAG: hypothetical protein JO079_01175 [Frankiaceae bacterium]|nr:hypothetical protein [Frankiaceae bacterium]
MTAPYGGPPQASPPYPTSWGQPAYGTTPQNPRTYDPVNWPVELVVAVVGTLFVTISGAVAGLLWDSVAPKLSFQALAANADQTFRPHIGADVWFLLVTVLAGVVTATLLCVAVRRPGPGAAVALGVGGLLGALVADRVGFIAERHAAVAGLRSIGFPPTGGLVTQVDFRVHALGVIVGWPLAALAVLGIFIAIEALVRRS